MQLPTVLCDQLLEGRFVPRTGGVEEVIRIGPLHSGEASNGMATAGAANDTGGQGVTVR